ncbi:endothelin-converting enzyme 1-like, partial [Asbolus verrucosus]
NREVCSSPVCVQTAAKVLQKIDLNANPCENFYKFACGKFLNNTALPPSKTTITSFSSVMDLVNEQMLTLLAKPIEITDARHVVLIKSLYQACMDTAKIEAHSFSYVQKLLKNIGGWPVTEGQNWDEESFNWGSTLQELTKQGLNSYIFFSLRTRIDVRNSSRSILQIDQPPIAYHEFMRKGFNESIIRSYYDYMVDIAIYFGADQEVAHHEMKDVLNFEIAMSRVAELSENRRNSSVEYNPMTIKELEQRFPYVPWLKFINEYLKPIKVMTYDDIITVTLPQYFERIIANVMFWKTVRTIIPFLNDELRTLQLNFIKTLSGRSERDLRWRECIHYIIRELYIASGALYVKHFFKKEAKQTMLELVGNIKHEFIEILRTTDWMDNVTRQHALEKAEVMQSHIAYPDELLDSNKVDEYYKNLTVNPSKYLESMQNVTLFFRQILNSQLDKPMYKNDWRNHAYSIITNARYHLKENSIDFPAGILQDVFFDNDRPQYMNYGGIGYVIGHEITHGFDDRGRQFDKNGNLVNWWQPKTKEAFDSKAQCIINQYGNITVPEINLNLNGKNTQGENIADNGGIKEAYLGYKKWVKEHAPEPLLPGLQYTPEQMFWISAANTWCGVNRKEILKIIVTSGVHSPIVYRVNVPFMNSDYFADDFNCPKGSPMNPTHKNPSWWRRRPRTQKYLLVVVGVLVILIIVVLALNFLQNAPGCKYGSHDICFTPACIKTAAQVLEKVDLSVNPCEDFYKFACGNFIKNTVIPEDKTFIDSFSIVSDKVDEQMEHLVKQPIAESDIKPFVLAKSIYQACMNTTQIEANSLSSFQRLIKSTGGWPVIEETNWNENDFDWISVIYKFMELGIAYNNNIFISFQVLPDVSNSSRNSLFLDQPTMALDKIKRKGFNETIFKAYYDYMVKVAVAFGAEKEKATEEMRDVANLIIAIARITVPSEERRNATLENNPKTIKELEIEFPYVPWLNYINKMLHPYKKMSYDDIVIVTVPAFYKQLESILNQTPKRTLANYLYWTITESYITYLNNDLRNMELEFYKVISGITKRPPRNKECTNQAVGLWVASGALYVRNLFKKEAKETLAEMIDFIKEQFTKTLGEVNWMDDTTKNHALDKIKTMHLHIAYPDELLDDQKLEDYYRNLTFSPTDYLHSILNLTLFKYHIEFPQLDEVISKKDWRNHAYVALVQAFYDHSENSIELLAGLLQDVFFDATKPKYMNYGSIGHFIGHEMTHGFDDEGRQFDKNGNLVDWWQPKTKAAFDEKAQCIIDQYTNITVPEVGLNLNGINTQGENIADNGGIKLAYLAYKEWIRKHGAEMALPGLQFTPEQMFWVSLANIWCKVIRTEELKIYIMNDAHTPNHYRVNVALMNSQYFIKDFGCPANSKMNPKRKCGVW